MYEFDKEAYRKRTAWFTEARFGFYIHWGIYAIPGRQNSEWIRSIEQIPAEEYEQRGENIWIARDAKIFDSAYIAGPCIIDHGAELRQCAFVRGNAIVGKNAVVGNSCELKNVVLFDNVQTPHFNYVGDSILGYKSHMGAGSITSNVKSDKTLVVIKNGAEHIETGRKKVGAILGDYVEVGCNSVLNPGTVIGRHSNIYPVSCVRGVIPADSILKSSGEVVHKK